MNFDKLTTVAGAPVTDNNNVLTAGPQGPMALQDVWFLEKLAHFDREVIPERRMHAKGSGAFGTFTVTHDITKYTKANLFCHIGKVTPVFVRFSTVAGERGAADAERDIRGFAIKFYTEEGNWDLVGNNTPVFFLRDPLNFPDLNHAVKRDPKTNMRSAQNNWDFWTSLPEALQQVTITMSEAGIPLSYRYMDGFGSHTFSFYDYDNNRIWVKFHFKTMQGLKYLTDQQAAAIIATDRESHQRDLYDAIERKDFPRWRMFIQVMTEEQALHHRDNPFDLTKRWYEDEYPLIPVGILELNQNPENYFAQVEQAAFNPANIVPGIGFSPDKMLQGRLFSYGDAQRYRLGVNHQLIPVNSAKCAPQNYYHRDGQMRTDDNFGATKGYQPNCYGLWQDSPEYQEPPLKLYGDLAHYDPRQDKTDDPYYQAGDLYKAMNFNQRKLLIENTVRSIDDATINIKYRHAAHCFLADRSYGENITHALDLDLKKVIALSKMPYKQRMKATACKPDEEDCSCKQQGAVPVYPPQPQEQDDWDEEYFEVLPQDPQDFSQDLQQESQEDYDARLDTLHDFEDCDDIIYF